ncbi:MAG: hypothetical protein WDN75_08460 [Bacteroidota bacterium]
MKSKNTQTSPGRQTLKTASAIILTVLVASTTAFSQRSFSKNEFSINGFRNPSVGLEFRHRQISYHAGYYPTAFKAGENTNFVKIGVTGWFLPVGEKENPSSFYAGVSYLRGSAMIMKVKMQSVPK